MKCAVITPVGPGHMALFAESCAPSVAQARAFDPGPFTAIDHLPMDDTRGEHGRSSRRNDAVTRAHADGYDWVFFLDADDVMTPNAFQAFGRVNAAEPDLEAIWGLICTYDDDGNPALRENQPEQIDSRAQLLAVEPFLSLQIGAFIRAKCAVRFPFCVDMNAGEDFRFYYQLWENCRCAKRPEIFFVNRRGQHSTGPRGATGADWAAAVAQLWADELGKVPVWAEIRDGGSAPARMRITNPRDLIQAAHLRGEYFENQSLNKLKTLLSRPNPSIVEVGANIGNHVVWYARHLDPARIIPVEPNPAALDLLEQNIQANDIAAQIDRRGWGLGAGLGEGRFDPVTDDQNNLGATRLVASATGGIETRSLDALMGADRVDFIKIDAEGMEMDVLRGASALIARDRPVIWVEVLKSNMMNFLQGWCRDAGYRVVDSTAYMNTIDYFAVPRD